MVNSNDQPRSIPELPPDIMRKIFKINWEESHNEMLANKKKYDNFVSNFNSCIRGLKYECLAEENCRCLANGEAPIFDTTDENEDDVLDDEQYDIMNICDCSEIVGNLREFEDEWCS